VATDMGGFAQAGGPVLVDQFGRPLAQSRNVLLPPYFRRDDITFDGTNATILTTNMPVSGTLQIVVRSGTTTRFMEQSEITYSPSSGYSLNYIPAAGDIGCVSYFSASPIIGPSTLATGVDPFFANVASLIHFDGPNGSTTFTDQKPVAWTILYGSPALSTAQYKYGGSSLYSTASGIITSAALAPIGASDYTWEFYLYLTSTSGIQILANLRSGSNPNNPELYLNSGVITYYALQADQIIGSTLSTGTWYHIALSRESGNSRLFVNGTQVGSTYADSNTYASEKLIYASNYTSNFPTQGYIDEARLTIGVGRYTTNFTPPILAFPNH